MVQWLPARPGKFFVEGGEGQLRGGSLRPLVERCRRNIVFIVGSLVIAFFCLFSISPPDLPCPLSAFLFGSQGILTTPDGQTCEGEFVEGNPHGKVGLTRALSRVPTSYTIPCDTASLDIRTQYHADSVPISLIFEWHTCLRVPRVYRLAAYLPVDAVA